MPLHKLTYQDLADGRLELVKEYLREGGDVNRLFPRTAGVGGNFGHTILYVACEFGYASMVDLVLEQSCVDPNKGRITWKVYAPQSAYAGCGCVVE